MTDKDEVMIEKLAEEAEAALNEECRKKDLKESRGVVKNTLYDGSKNVVTSRSKR